jgi:hypothetical protein
MLMDSSSSKKRVHLLARGDLQAFVLDLANSQADREQLAWRLGKFHPGMVPSPEDIEATSKPGGAFEPGEAKQWLENCFWNLQLHLRHAWQQPKGYPRIAALADLRQLPWHLHRLFEQSIFEQNRTDGSLPAFRAGRCWLNVYLAVHHAELLDDQDKMAVCANPGCCTPYFFAIRRGQRFCSEKCAGTGNREAKRRWWRKHGKQWRNKQRGTKTRKEKKHGERRETGVVEAARTVGVGRLQRGR